jgi:hypothetical protein
VSGASQIAKRPPMAARQTGRMGAFLVMQEGCGAQGACAGR